MAGPGDQALPPEGAEHAQRASWEPVHRLLCPPAAAGPHPWALWDSHQHPRASASPAEELLTIVSLVLEWNFVSIFSILLLLEGFTGYCTDLRLPYSKQFIYAVTINCKCILFALCFPLFSLSLPRFIKYKRPNTCQPYYPFGRPQGIFINHLRSKQLIYTSVNKIHITLTRR